MPNKGKPHKKGNQQQGSSAGSGNVQPPRPKAPAAAPRGQSSSGTSQGPSAGRGMVQPPRPQAPTASAWVQNPSGTRDTYVSAPPPTNSAWGKPIQQPREMVQPPRPQAPTASAWVQNPSGTRDTYVPAPTPTISAWGKPIQQQTPSTQLTQAMGGIRIGQPVTSRQPTQEQPSFGENTQPRQGPRQQAGQQPSEQSRQQPQQQSKQEPSRGAGASGAGGANRGSTRGKSVISDIIRTKPANMNSKTGTEGAVVPLLTNYFQLNKKPNWELYQYRVDFAPETMSEGQKKFFIREQKNLFGGYLFDGTMLFLTVKLQHPVSEFISKDKENKEVKTTVKFTNLLSMTSAQSIQVLNLIQRKSMNALKLQLVGRNFFDPEAMIDIPRHRLQLWPGYITSIRQHESAILLCAEITTKVMRNETLLDILISCYKRNSLDYKNLFQKEVIGMIVLTKYNNKSYRIHDVDFAQTPSSTFVRKGKTISYVDYYKTKEINIKQMDQPLLISRVSDRELRAGEVRAGEVRAGEDRFFGLIPELCHPTGLNEEMRRNFFLMQDIATHTRLSPAARLSKLRGFNVRLQTSADSQSNFKEWDFELDTNLVHLKGRCLPNERILFGNKKEGRTGPTGDWSRDVRSGAMFVSQPLRNWVIIYASQHTRDVDAFMGQLMRAATGMSYGMTQPAHISIANDSATSYSAVLDTVATKYNPQLIMCFVSNQIADRYSAIKKKCCVARGIPTQVMVMKTIIPKKGKDIGSLLTVGTKVVIQMNTKLGGVPWMLDIPLSGLMIIGFDVYHDTINKKKSYGAMVATMDMKLKQNYFSAVTAHESGIELSDHFSINILKAVDAFTKQHGRRPAKIVIYRDGVGEGQTDYVFVHEIKTIRDALKKAYNGVDVEMAFIVVSKRINTRFFKDPKNPQNPSPGTIVDDVVTLPHRYDFFMVSQSVTQGTVSPTNYNVLHDNSKLSTDRLQILTYKMTHLYYNWTGTLRVPAVCQYAHKLAFLVGNYIHDTPNSLLEKQLYFL